MRAGLMDRRIELRHRSTTQEAVHGHQAASWATTYATVWARREDVSGREYFQAQQKQAELTTRFTIRYRSDVLATDRLTCDGQDYELTQPPSHVGRRSYLTLFARAVNQSG